MRDTSIHNTSWRAIPIPAVFFLCSFSSSSSFLIQALITQSSSFLIQAQPLNNSVSSSSSFFQVRFFFFFAYLLKCEIRVWNWIGEIQIVKPLNFNGAFFVHTATGSRLSVSLFLTVYLFLCSWLFTKYFPSLFYYVLNEFP